MIQFRCSKCNGIISLPEGSKDVDGKIINTQKHSVRHVDCYGDKKNNSEALKQVERES